MLLVAPLQRCLTHRMKQFETHKDEAERTSSWVQYHYLRIRQPGRQKAGINANQSRVPRTFTRSFTTAVRPFTTAVKPFTSPVSCKVHQTKKKAASRVSSSFHFGRGLDGPTRRVENISLDKAHKELHRSQTKQTKKHSALRRERTARRPPHTHTHLFHPLHHEVASGVVGALLHIRELRLALPGEHTLAAVTSSARTKREQNRKEKKSNQQAQTRHQEEKQKHVSAKHWVSFSFINYETLPFSAVCLPVCLPPTRAAKDEKKKKQEHPIISR